MTDRHDKNPDDEKFDNWFLTNQQGLSAFPKDSISLKALSELNIVSKDWLRDEFRTEENTEYDEGLDEQIIWGEPNEKYCPNCHIVMNRAYRSDYAGNYIPEYVIDYHCESCGYVCEAGDILVDFDNKFSQEYKQQQALESRENVLLFRKKKQLKSGVYKKQKRNKRVSRQMVKVLIQRATKNKFGIRPYKTEKKHYEI